MNISASLRAKIIREIKPNEIYWDRNSEMSPDQLDQIFASEEGFLNIENELMDYNMDHIIDLEYESVKTAVEACWDYFPKKLRKQYNDDFEEFWEEHDSDLRNEFLDYAGVDANLEQLIRNSSFYPCLFTGVNYSLWEEKTKNTYEDLKELFEFLQVNPYEFASQYGYNPAAFPNILSRKKPFIRLDDLAEILEECPSGEVVCLLNDKMDLIEFGCNWEKYHQKIHCDGSNMVIYSYDYGNSSKEFSMPGFVFDKRFHSFNYNNCTALKYSNGRFTDRNQYNTFNSTITIYSEKIHGKFTDKSAKKSLQLQ